MKKRDRYIDICRGAASVSIIFIHTVFASGWYYIPAIMRTIALLIDVPFFVFLSGQSTFYSASIRRFANSAIVIWILWASYITVIDLIYPRIDIDFSG